MRRRILFIHQNAPGQFEHLIRFFSESADYEVAVIGDRRRLVAHANRLPAGIHRHGYDVETIDDRILPDALKYTFHAMRRSRAAVLCMEDLRSKGFVPEVVYGHPGWGEMMHVRDIFPNTRIVNYAEFYFNESGQDLTFDAEFQPPLDDCLRVRTDNMPQLVSIAAGDAAISPTRWQYSRYPAIFQRNIRVIHDGVDERLGPLAGVALTVPGTSVRLHRGIPVVTYVARNLEPYRGFPSFMRSLPAILSAVPTAHVLIIGDDATSYSTPPASGRSFREMMLSELSGSLDLSRVHFVGRVSYSFFVSAMQLSRVHVYLTYPFVLSWSLVEAMAIGATVVGSRTPPVEEVLMDGVTGYLVDFFDHDAIASKVVDVLQGELPPTCLAARAAMTAREYRRSECVRRQREVLFPL